MAIVQRPGPGCPDGAGRGTPGYQSRTPLWLSLERTATTTCWQFSGPRHAEATGRHTSNKIEDLKFNTRVRSTRPSGALVPRNFFVRDMLGAPAAFSTIRHGGENSLRDVSEITHGRRLRTSP